MLVLGGLLVAGRSPATAQISPGPLARPHAKLEGSLQCTSCHGGGGPQAMTAQCLDCHKDVAWLAARGLGLHGREGKTACASCHPDHAGVDFKLVSWTEGDSTRFDHGRTGWVLDGAHRTTKCADCHKAELRRSPAAALSRPAAARRGWLGLDRACASCHEDAHRGALSQKCLDCHDTRDWKPAPRFDHGRTDYPLTGKHAEVACDKCHLAPAAVTRRTPEGKPIPVYRPLAHRECSDCHQDPHRGDLGANCASCHETASFTKVSRSAFDHDRTRYPLRGRHATVACAKCHDPAGPKGKRPPFATCAACHADPHAGTATLAGRPADCAACHDVGGFIPATFTVAQHRQSRYALEGKHQQVACSACHVKNPPGMPRPRLGPAGTLLRPKFARCRDCHGDDHGTQLTGRADGRRLRRLPRRRRLDTEHLHRRRARRAPGDARWAARGDRLRRLPRPEARKGLPPLPAALDARTGRACMLSPREIDCVSCHVDPHQGRFAAGGAAPRTAAASPATASPPSGPPRWTSRPTASTPFRSRARTGRSPASPAMRT